MNKKGFTLIELLIVVSIIGILAVALIPTLTDAPSRARDAARKAKVSDIISAIEAFNIDQGRYPSLGAVGTSYCLGGTAEDGTPAGDETLLLGSSYLREAPTTNLVTNATACPGGAADSTYFWYTRTATGYTVDVAVEGSGTDTNLHTDTGTVNYYRVTR